MNNGVDEIKKKHKMNTREQAFWMFVLTLHLQEVISPLLPTTDFFVGSFFTLIFPLEVVAPIFPAFMCLLWETQ